MSYLNTLKLIMIRSIKDFENAELRKILYLSVFITLSLTILVFITFFYLTGIYLNEYLTNLSAENLINSMFITFIKFVLLSSKLYLIFIIFPIILIPIAEIVSSFLLEKMLKIINKNNEYKFVFQKKSNYFIKSLYYASIDILILFVANIIILPLYIFLPIANILIFTVINGYLIGKINHRNILMLFYKKKEIENHRDKKSKEMYTLGSFTAFLYWVPFFNLVAPFLSLVIFLHLFLLTKNEIS